MYWFDKNHSTERSRECQRRTLYERAELLSVPSAGSWWLHGLDVPGGMCAGDGSKASILVRSCRPFRSWLGEKPVLSGVRRYCIRNSYRAGRGGSLDFFSDCLKDCTVLSAAPLVAGW